MSLLEQALERQRKGIEVIDITYDCELCHDCGFVALDFKGNRHPATSIPSSEHVAISVCNCKIREGIRTNMQYSGLDLSEYDKKTLKTFKQDTTEAKEMYALALKFLAEHKPQGIGYFGKSGTGKTHICIAICHELALRNIQHRYFNYRTDIQILKQLKYEYEEYSKKMNDYKSCSVLYIDDLFKLVKNNRGEVDQQELQIMFEIINARYMNKKTIIVSSEYTVNEIKDIDEATGGRIYEMLNGFGMKCKAENRRIKGR